VWHPRRYRVGGKSTTSVPVADAGSAPRHRHNSSLAYVERLPLDIIKIDKAFVDGVGDSGDDGHLASVIVSLGDRLDLETVAEGIEVAEQGDELRRMGCQFGQGYHLARPQTLSAIRRLIAEGAADPAPDATIAAA
jgi:EAL domain-containing protein (putative c-di-GMP-specific phosphodiesterase class I)